MKILVTGGAGYLGTRVVAKLLVRGHSVRVLDLGPLHIGQLPHDSSLEVMRTDLTSLLTDDRGLKDAVRDCDSIIHLAAVSSDSAAERDPVTAKTVNVDVTRTLAERARDEGMGFVFSSTCAVYGTVDHPATEEEETSPLTVYADTKLQAESQLDELAQEGWSPVTLRNGTLFGFSPRMRFDLVVNIFCLHSTLNNEIKLFGEGKHSRPFIHVDDCARALVEFAETPPGGGHKRLNIAHENLRVVDLVETFRKLNPRLNVTLLQSESDDPRTYRVSTERAEAAGFTPRIGLYEGAEDLIQAMVLGLVPDPASSSRRFPKWGFGSDQQPLQRD
jgi:nucleoside-diphosphate-sugar epimerase